MSGDSWFTVRWEDEAVALIDQRLLPSEERYLHLRDVEAVALAIEDLVVRGAPAIGCTAALGLALAARTSTADTPEALIADVDVAARRLARTRPTAVNLFWALDRMRTWLANAAAGGASAQVLRDDMLVEATELVDEDIEICRKLGAAGASLVPDNARILTHCNAGALATGGYGTALGVVRAAVEAGRRVSVLADETRPFLQGARLTAWELDRDRIPVEVITDNMAAHFMGTGEVDLVIVGADRVAANGDVANKIGTYGLALLADAHQLPFYVAAPCSTIDPDTPDGGAIPIEERGREEVADFGARPVVPDGVAVRHPAFDVTPAHLVSAIVTERGVARAPFGASLAAMLRPACGSSAGS
ncbi:MAG: S-methyl-5-thioribose-1-phosphate isomerase [bacterium]|nr:S-methyl-5-thioribose-1-phosphate isomerase [bacterium]MCP5070845.1 S-methyl-5-thioribose-1-phosphate isomerase [bacterium]